MVTETGHNSMAVFVNKCVNITLPHQCDAKQESEFSCSSSNGVASFKSKEFLPPPQLPCPLLLDGYVFQFHTKYKLSKTEYLIRYYYVQYIASLLLEELIM